MAYDTKQIVRNPLGRPPKYRPEYAQQLIDFFENAAIDEYKDQPILNDKGEETGESLRVLVKKGFFPTLARFAVSCGVCQITLRNWAEAKDIDDVTPLYPEFFTAYRQAQSMQEVVLAEGYTSGQWANPGFGALIAKNLTVWRDKQEIEQNVNANVKQEIAATVQVGGLAEKLAKLAGKANDEG